MVAAIFLLIFKEKVTVLIINGLIHIALLVISTSNSSFMSLYRLTILPNNDKVILFFWGAVWGFKYMIVDLWLMVSVSQRFVFNSITTEQKLNGSIRMKK